MATQIDSLTYFVVLAELKKKLLTYDPQDAEYIAHAAALKLGELDPSALHAIEWFDGIAGLFFINRALRDKPEYYGVIVTDFRWASFSNHVSHGAFRAVVNDILLTNAFIV